MPLLQQINRYGFTNQTSPYLKHIETLNEAKKGALGAFAVIFYLTPLPLSVSLTAAIGSLVLNALTLSFMRYAMDQYGIIADAEKMIERAELDPLKRLQPVDKSILLQAVKKFFVYSIAGLSIPIAALVHTSPILIIAFLAGALAAYLPIPFGFTPIDSWAQEHNIKKADINDLAKVCQKMSGLILIKGLPKFTFRDRLALMALTYIAGVGKTRGLWVELYKDLSQDVATLEEKKNQLEKWAESSELNRDEAHELRIIKEKLHSFSIDERTKKVFQAFLV